VASPKSPITSKPRKPLPFVKEGEELRFVERLRRIGKWPLVRDRKRPQDPRRPVFSPYLVLQAAPGDQGARPLANDQQVFYNESVQILDSVGNSVTIPEKGKSYTLACRVTNLGNLGAFGGIAEFHVAPPATVDVLASTSKPLLAVRGYEGFTAKPGDTVTVTSRRVWTPATDQEAMSTIVVHAHDPFNDLIKMRFDARNDRHVARRDTIPDFRGVWKGVLTGYALTPGTWNLLLDITQLYQNLSISIYIAQASLPTTPQATVSAIVVGGTVSFVTGGVVPVSANWQMAWQGANDLKVVLSYPRDFMADGVLHR
jgi:hypothetical protein